MDKTEARALARGITVQTGTGDRSTRLLARAHPVSKEADEQHGWAVAVTTPSQQQFLVINAGGLIRDLERAEEQWSTIRGFAEWALGHPVQEQQERDRYAKWTHAADQAEEDAARLRRGVLGTDES